MLEGGHTSHNHLGGIIVQVKWSKWDPPPKVVENDHAEVWDFQLQMDKQVIKS